MGDSIGLMVRLYRLAVLNDRDLDRAVLEDLREQEGLSRVGPGVVTPRHVKIDVSAPTDPPAVGGSVVVDGLRETVLAELETMLADIAEETVAAVNHSQVLRVIRAGREDC